MSMWTVEVSRDRTWDVHTSYGSRSGIKHLETREIGVGHGKELRECDEILRGGVGARGENLGEPLRSRR
jgi:hypothetical protein